MKYKTSELTGALLDAVVAKALGLIFTIAPAVDIQQAGRQLTRDICRVENGKSIWMVGFFPSSNWADGGPIIDREKIGCYWIADESQWRAGLDMHGYTPEFDLAQSHGPTMLIASMRAFVAVKMGAEVDL